MVRDLGLRAAAVLMCVAVSSSLVIVGCGQTATSQVPARSNPDANGASSGWAGPVLKARDCEKSPDAAELKIDDGNAGSIHLKPADATGVANLYRKICSFILHADHAPIGSFTSCPPSGNTGWNQILFRRRGKLMSTTKVVLTGCEFMAMDQYRLATNSGANRVDFENVLEAIQMRFGVTRAQLLGKVP